MYLFIPLSALPYRVPPFLPLLGSPICVYILAKSRGASSSGGLPLSRSSELSQRSEFVRRLSAVPSLDLHKDPRDFVTRVRHEIAGLGQLSASKG